MEYFKKSAAMLKKIVMFDKKLSLIVLFTVILYFILSTFMHLDKCMEGGSLESECVYMMCQKS